MNTLTRVISTPTTELLAEKIQGKEGQQVLVVREQTNDYLNDRTGYDLKVFLGVLTHVPVREEQADILLPTEQYVRKRIIQGVERWERIQGAIPVHKIILLPDVEGKVEEPIFVREGCYGARLNQLKGCSLLVDIGDEVPMYFAKGGPCRSNGVPDNSYVEALDLLGHNVVPLLFKGAYQHFVERRALDTFTTLEILIMQEKSSNNQEKEILQGRIRSALFDAFEVGMHKEPLTIQGHNPGVSVDVPAYLKHVANVYKLKIPK